MRGGQNSSSSNSSRPPPSGGVTQRVLTAKDIKVIMNSGNPSCIEATDKNQLQRKDSKLGRKEKLQLTEKEANEMTKSKRF